MLNQYTFRKFRAFSMIELLIVIAIIGILVSIAVPSYRNYTKRARFTEVVMSASPYKMAIALALQSGESLDRLNTGSNGIPIAAKSTKNLASIEVKHGVIIGTATTAAGGYTYILTPDAHGSHWRVSGTCLAAGVCK